MKNDSRIEEGNMKEGTIVQCIGAGFDVFVEKPVDPDELVSVIGGLVDLRAQRPGARPDARRS
jgi:CheY-like chemotaxis protein